MSNLSDLNNISSMTYEVPNMTLDELLDSLGFKSWLIIASTFVLPIINIFGLIFCSISAWIFFQKKFKDPIFFYYRVLTFVFIIHLLHNIPYCLFFSPKYFASLNTYVISIYQTYYSWMSNALFLCEDALQTCILLTKMKTFNKLLKKHFTASPKII